MILRQDFLVDSHLFNCNLYIHIFKDMGDSGGGGGRLLRNAADFARSSLFTTHQLLGCLLWLHIFLSTYLIPLLLKCVQIRALYFERLAELGRESVKKCRQEFTF
jgi:hypothetical protein